MANAVYRGPSDRQPHTISNRTVSGALLPCTFVFIGASQFTQATAISGGRVALLASRDFYSPMGAHFDANTWESMQAPKDALHWLAQQFPADNRLPNRKYYSVSIHDNAHNLPKELMAAALAASLAGQVAALAAAWPSPTSSPARSNRRSPTWCPPCRR